MHISRFSKPFVFAIAITLILSVLSCLGYAQHQSLMPPVSIPQRNLTPAVPEIRIIDAKLAQIGPSHAFEVTFEPYFWMGLDKGSNPIRYNYPRGSEIIEQTPAESFTRYSRQLKGYAKVYLDFDKEYIVESKITIAKADEPATVKIGLIQANQRILPGIYRINVEIPIKTLPSRDRDYIWVDESRLNTSNYVDTKRISPGRTQMIVASAMIAITNQENGTYRSLRMGAVNYYSNALTQVELIETFEKSIKSMEDKLKDIRNAVNGGNAEELGENAEALQLQYSINKKKQELSEAKFFKSRVEEIRKALKDETKVYEEMNTYLTTFNKQLKDACTEITEGMRELYLEMWWTGNLCLPDWAPSEKLGTLEELRKKWKISRFLKGDLATKEVHGNWKKDAWVKWMKEEWLPKLEPLKKKFRLFMGDQNLKEDDRWYYGLTENMQETFWYPKNKNAYKELKTIFVLNYMEDYGKATGNLIAYYHDKDKKDVDYPFIDEEMKRPKPAPLNAKVYYDRLKRARREFDKAFAPKQDPTVRPDLSKVKKRKYYVSKDGLYIGPNEYDPVTGERNDGPYDESILNPTDQVGE